jgi:hypothetical protein
LKSSRCEAFIDHAPCIFTGWDPNGDEPPLLLPQPQRVKAAKRTAIVSFILLLSNPAPFRRRSVLSTPGGYKILDGTGLAAVRERIEEAFSHVLTGISASKRKTEIVEEVKINIEPETAREKPLRSLANRAEPILRVAERCFEQAVVRRHHHNAVYRISVPCLRED